MKNMTTPIQHVATEHVRAAISAALEALNGAPANRILELADKIVVAKAILQGVVIGQLAISGTLNPPPAGAPTSRNGSDDAAPPKPSSPASRSRSR